MIYFDYAATSIKRKEILEDIIKIQNLNLDFADRGL